ncbi:MAG: porin family protein [Bacteroidia bacterium]|nr:porin family protein [Bacteroidia bacterium]
MQDDKIKALLADAEIKPSRRVWRNIASRLDAAAAPAAGQSWAWAKWAGVAVAFAAIVLGVFVFTGRQETEQPIPTYINITEAPTAQASPVLDEPELVVLKPESDVRVAHSVKAVKPAETVVEETEEALKEEETPSAVEADEPAPVVEKEHKAAPAPSAPVRQPDAFAQMEFEDLQQFNPSRTLYAQGAIGGNDSDIRFKSNAARMSSGTAVPKTGITELGESVFGIPFSLGLGVRFYLTPKLSLGAGVSYSLLSRTFEGEYQRVSSAGIVEFSQTGNVHHQMHYVGIPVNAYYDIIGGENIKFYVFGGGEAEFCVSNKYTLYSDTDIIFRSPVNSVQWSAGAGLGVEFKLSPVLGLYVEPSARYYFHNNQPKNVRTERPFMANLDAGLRFDF